jgi:hypothetical protein
MNTGSTPSKGGETPPKEVQKSAEMRRADTANGENPESDAVESSPSERHRHEAPHTTGEPGARENAENDPPA